MAEPVVIGIDFGGSKIATGVCECDGTLLGTASVDTRPGDGGPANLMSGLQAARELASRVAPRRPVAAVGACTFGIPGELGIALAPAIPGWAGLALEEELRRSFPGAEVRVATDVKAAAQVEADSGALAGHDPGIYVNLGSGLAVAVVASGKVLQGRHGAAGEVAYNLRTVRDVGVPAHARTNLEDAVSGRALTRAMSVSDDGAPSQPDTADPRFGESLRVSVTELAFHLVNLAIAIDPERIVVGGGMVRWWDHFAKVLRHALDAAVPYPPELVPARYPYDAPLRGALSLGCDAARVRTGNNSSAKGRTTR